MAENRFDMAEVRSRMAKYGLEMAEDRFYMAEHRFDIAEVRPRLAEDRFDMAECGFYMAELTVG